MVQGLDRRLDLRRDFDKPRPSASARHQPPITPLSRPTLLTGQGLAQAEKPKPACSLAPHSSRASTGEERRIDLHPVLLRAGVLPRPDKLRASRERPAKLHEAPSSRQLRHVEPAGLASSSCCGTRSESVAERVGEHASGGLLSACHVFTGGTSSLCAQGSLGILATLQHIDAQLWKLNSPPRCAASGRQLLTLPFGTQQAECIPRPPAKRQSCRSSHMAAAGLAAIHGYRQCDLPSFLPTQWRVSLRPLG